MMNYKFENNGSKMVVNADADMFIIPNKASVAGDFMHLSKSFIKNANVVCESVGKKYDEDYDRLVQVWFTSDDLMTENIQCHGFSIDLDDSMEDYIMVSGYGVEFIPDCVLRGIKEGESINLTFSLGGEYANKKRDEDGKDIDVELHLNVTARQLRYRYARFGRFEEAMKHVMR